MDQIKCMRTFARVAHARSFAAAARDLRMSAATVTKQVSALEKGLGVRLFERSTRKVQLTEAGRFYLDRCLETLQSIDDTEAAMSQLKRAPSGLLRVTAPTDFGRPFGRAVATFASEYPEVVVEVHHDNHNVDLIEAGYDVGVGLLNASHASYICRPLCTWNLGVYAAPSYLRRHGTPRKPADLTGHRNLVFAEPQPRTVWPFRKGNRATEVTLPVGALSNSAAALHELAIGGVGVVIAPSFLVEDDIAAGLLREVLTDYQLPTIPVHVRYPSRRFLPAKVRCFLEALLRYFENE